MANTTGQKFGGRQKGTPNKDTKQIKEAIQQILSSNIDNIDTWLTEVAENDPAKAIDLTIKLCEYVVPKLTRITEIKDNSDLTSLIDKLFPPESEIIFENKEIKPIP